MDKRLTTLITFLTLFIIFFLIDYFFIKKRHYKKSKKKKKNEDLVEIAYLIGKFKLDKNKLINNKIFLIISIINAFIISLVASIVLIIDINVILQLLIGFILLLALIYAMYELLGKYLKKRGYDNNGK